MIGLRTTFLGGAVLAGLSLAGGLPSHAAGLTSKACGAKYQEAKTAGTLNGMNYKAFRTAQCGDAAAAGAATPAAAPAAPTAPAATPAAPAASTAAAGAPTFPSAIAPKYASETAGKGRMHTCLDQYHANKTTNANGGLHWIQKGGGYYSECSKHLKG